MSDVIQKIGHSIIHHGKENDRVYLMKYNEIDGTNLIKKIELLGLENHYKKIIAKIPFSAKKEFDDFGYVQEAHIPNYYNGKDDCVFMCKYLRTDNEINHSREVLDILSTTKSKSNTLFLPILSRNFDLRILTKNDADAMSALYKTVFATYPFPIFDPSYLIKTMNDNIIYFGILKDNKLIAIASCETDSEYMNCEMTDFAILPEYRGNNYALLLLKEMEYKMNQLNYKVLYTIARAMSYGMNIAFSKLGYTFSGTLYNNTNISGNIEHMNVWYKII